MGRSKSNVGGFVDTIANYASSLSKKVKSMSEREALIFLTGCFGLFVVVLRLTVSFYEAYLPSMLSWIIRLLVYVVVPLVAALGAVAGIWVQHKFDVHDELFDWLHSKVPEVFPSAAQAGKQRSTTPKNAGARPQPPEPSYKNE